MVAIVGDDLLKRSKELFKKGDVHTTLEIYEQGLSNVDKSQKPEPYFNFLNELLKYCKESGLKEEEALVLRAMGRTYSLFKNYVEALKHHWLSLKIQRKFGKKVKIAESLMFIAEDQVISGNYEESLKAYTEAKDIYRELGKIKKAKFIEKEVKKLQDFSKTRLEEDYIMNKFHVDDY